MRPRPAPPPRQRRRVSPISRARRSRTRTARRGSTDLAVAIAVGAERIARHNVVRMRPAGQGLHTLEPGGDRRMLLGDVEAELLHRIVEIGRHLHVGYGRPAADVSMTAY